MLSQEKYEVEIQQLQSTIKKFEQRIMEQSKQMADTLVENQDLREKNVVILPSMQKLKESYQNKDTINLAAQKLFNRAYQEDLKENALLIYDLNMNIKFKQKFNYYLLQICKQPKSAQKFEKCQGKCQNRIYQQFQTECGCRLCDVCLQQNQCKSCGNPVRIIKKLDDLQVQCPFCSCSLSVSELKFHQFDCLQNQNVLKKDEVASVAFQQLLFLHNQLQKRVLEFSQFVQSLFSQNASLEKQVARFRGAVDVKVEQLKEMQKFVDQNEESKQYLQYLE